MAGPGLLAVPAHRRLPDGGAGVRRALRAGAHPHRAGRRDHAAGRARCCPRPASAPFSAAGAASIAAQQVLIGVALGFALQIVFDALGAGGQLLANSMGLSFAFNVDPLRGVSTPVLGQLYVVLVTLTFLALNGHWPSSSRWSTVSATCPSAAPAWHRGHLQVCRLGRQLLAGARSSRCRA